MQSVLCIEQISRLRVPPAVPLAPSPRAPSIHSHRACATEAVKGRALMPGGYRLRRLLRVAHRLRPRQRRRAKARPRLSDANPQEWDEK